MPTEFKDVPDHVKDLMRTRFGWTDGSEMPERYAKRALTDQANLTLMEFNQQLLDAVQTRKNHARLPMAYKNIGNTVIEWDDGTPFIFTMKEESGPENARVLQRETIDMNPLRTSCEDVFLLHLKESVIETRNRLALSTVRSLAQNLCGLLTKLAELGMFDAKLSIIDEAFLLCLASVQEKIPRTYLASLAKLFDAKPSSPLFANGLQKLISLCQCERKGGTAARSTAS